MTDKIISIIQNKFIENLDEGIVLNENDFPEFDLTEEEKSFYRNYTYRTQDPTGRKWIGIPNKKNPISYLTAKYLRTKIDDYYPSFNSVNYREAILKYWKQRSESLKSILHNCKEFLQVEALSEKDRFYINVGYRDWELENPDTRSNKANDLFGIYNNNNQYFFVKKADIKKIKATFADVFIISGKYFIKLSIGEKGVIDRTEHIIQRDIKKIAITDNVRLEIYFHGHFDPETIILDDYKSAIDLQRYLTELRQSQKDSKNYHKR